MIGKTEKTNNVSQIILKDYFLIGVLNFQLISMWIYNIFKIWSLQYEPESNYNTFLNSDIFSLKLLILILIILIAILSVLIVFYNKFINSSGNLKIVFFISIGGIHLALSQYTFGFSSKMFASHVLIILTTVVIIYFDRFKKYDDYIESLKMKGKHITKIRIIYDDLCTWTKTILNGLIYLGIAIGILLTIFWSSDLGFESANNNLENMIKWNINYMRILTIAIILNFCIVTGGIFYWIFRPINQKINYLFNLMTK